MEKVTVVGAGLAGCEAAWQLARRNIEVELVEMKPAKKTPAHVTNDFGELVCSNSLRSDELSNAAGLLKEEMRRLDGLIIRCADACRVPAGGALAVDRGAFSAMITESVCHHPKIHVTSAELKEIPDGQVIIATGPLTSEALSMHIAALMPQTDALHFYDAAAPLISAESIDMDKAFFASRYGKGTADYINCPMTKAQYTAFWLALRDAEEAPVHGFDDGCVFEGCMPVEVMARRGEDTLRYGPLKPVGITNPRTGEAYYAVVQLRKDNAVGSVYNMVGFQTHLRFPEQRRVFSMIPGLEHAEFLRYGVMHRNTYLDSPRVLDRYYRFKAEPRIRFAGQMTGVEGYIESAASGLLAGIETARAIHGLEPVNFPRTTAIGALALYISDASVTDFQPMNINFGIIEPLGTRVKGKRNKGMALSKRALEQIEHLMAQQEI